MTVLSFAVTVSTAALPLSMTVITDAVALSTLSLVHARPAQTPAAARTQRTAPMRPAIMAIRAIVPPRDRFAGLSDVT
jgi:hypothetical protein